MIYKVLFKTGGTYIVLSLENVSVLSHLLKIDFDQSYESFSQIKTIAFCRRHQAEEVMVKNFLTNRITPFLYHKEMSKLEWEFNKHQSYHVHFAASCKYHIHFKTMTEFQLRSS